MRKVIYICDKCGEHSESAMFRIEDFDVCDKCFEQLKNMVSKWIGNTNEPKQTEKVKKEPKKIDDGKIKALRNAGWTLKAIAEEIGCSQPTVLKHLRDMEERGEEG